MSGKYTPTPWTSRGAHVFADRKGPTGGNVCTVSDPRSSKSVGYCELDYGSPDMNEAFANAAFIVRACNSHEALVSVMRDLFENPQFQVAIGGNPNMVDALMERARAALQLARGEG